LNFGIIADPNKIIKKILVVDLTPVLPQNYFYN